MNAFSKRLKELRTEKGITQKELAEAIGTTDDSIYSWEHGRSRPSLELLKNIASYFEVTIDYLLEFL